MKIMVSCIAVSKASEYPIHFCMVRAQSGIQGNECAKLQIMQPFTNVGMLSTSSCPHLMPTLFLYLLASRKEDE